MGSETRPTSKAQNSGAGARGSTAARKRAPTGPGGTRRAGPSDGVPGRPKKQGPTPCNRPQEAAHTLPERNRRTAGSRATQPPRRWRPNADACQSLPSGTRQFSLHVLSHVPPLFFPHPCSRAETVAGRDRLKKVSTIEPI
jgi:hypothetical protein